MHTGEVKLDGVQHSSAAELRPEGLVILYRFYLLNSSQERGFTGLPQEHTFCGLGGGDSSHSSVTLLKKACETLLLRLQHGPYLLLSGTYSVLAE